MPCSGGRRKTKSTRSKVSTNDAIEQTHITEIDNSESWDLAVSMLCSLFDLPDLTTRSGLKKVHSGFNAIYGRIDAFYQRNDNTKIRGAIVAIYAKMCVDAILRDKLFEKGVLDSIMPLCQIDGTRHVALRALKTITHHGGTDVRAEVAKHANSLAKLLRDLPDDETVAELVVVTLAHSVTAVAEGDEQPVNPAVLKQLAMSDIYKSVLEAIRRPFISPRVNMINHALELVALSCMHSAPSLKAYPPSIGFLVAGIRSKDWITRSTCFGALIRLHRLEAEDDPAQFDPRVLAAAVGRGIPQHLNNVLMNYGALRSDMVLTMHCTRDFTKAMFDCLKDENLYTLGLTQAKLIPMTEFAIVDGYFQTEDDHTGEWTNLKTGLPFTRWTDSLPHCARAIRNVGKPAEQDYADILDIKYHIINRRLEEAFRIAKKGIDRNPEQAYFFYALSLSGDNVQGLRASKKGMKCKLTTPFLKFQMMQRSVDHAGDMGIKILQGQSEAGDKKWEEGIAFLLSALEDAKAYFDGAPPDTRYMKDVGYWLVLLSVLISEKLSSNLSELQPTLQKLQVAEEFSLLFGGPPRNTNLRLAQQAAVKHYASGLRDFAGVFDILDKAQLNGGAQAVNTQKSGDDLAAWLEDMRLEDGTIEDVISSINARDKSEVKVDYKNLTLYKCSWCGNPSAALRKCSGCSLSRYCDGGCQKAHWPTHKSKCKR